MPRDANPYGGQGVTTIDAKVTGVDPFDCNSGGQGPDGLPQVKGDCAHITASIDDGTATFDLDAARYKAGIKAGDEVKILRIAPKGQAVSYEFLDFRRGLPLTALAAIFSVLVVVVARWRGLFALAGIAVTMLALTKFILPAFLAGESPLLVAIVGSTAIMIVVLYLAHGISIRTTSALFGTLVGIGLTGLLGLGATAWTNLSGVGSENDQMLVASVPGIHLPGCRRRHDGHRGSRRAQRRHGHAGQRGVGAARRAADDARSARCSPRRCASAATTSRRASTPWCSRMPARR